MNWDKLKHNIGYKVQLVPVACHLDAAGDILPPRGEDWSITSSGADFLEIRKDHVHHYTSDAKRSAGGDNYGFLTLNVQASLDIFRGLPDAAERKLNTEPYWTFDWDTGQRRQVGTVSTDGRDTEDC